MKNTSKDNLLIITIGAIALIIGLIVLFPKAEDFLYEDNSTTTPPETPEITAETQPETDKRILLTINNLSDYNSPQNPQCDEKFNNNPANTTAPYSNKEKGISFDVPYNSNWGNSKFKIEPYWEEENLISFGPIEVFEACMWTRLNFVKFKPQLSAEEVVNKVQNSELPELILVKPTIIKINDLTIIKYATSGMCDYPALQVIGKKYNYEFTLGCSADIENDFKYLENIIKSVKLL